MVLKRKIYEKYYARQLGFITGLIYMPQFLSDNGFNKLIIILTH